ncbi:MAG: ATP-binding protein [Bacteroidales bacterium]|nr:ATP-binding protein [Bacteroidales bacterium]
MEQNIRIRLLESIGKIYEESKDCKLEPAFFETVENDLNVLSDYFGISNTQSLLVAMIFSLNYKGDTVDFNDLTEYFDCNPMKLLEYSSDFENLYSKGIFKKEKSRHRIKLALSNDQFTINEKVTEAILNNMPLPKLGDEEVGDVFEFLENICKIGERRDADEISTNELLLQLIQLVNSNVHFPLIKMVNDYNFKPEDTFVYLYLIWKTICGNELVDLNTMVEGVFDKPTRRIQYVQKIMSNENTLIRNGLIEIVEARFLNDTGIKLSDKSCKLIEECGVKLLTKKKTDQNNTIAPNQIFTKYLFYNDAEAKQLSVLKQILQDENFTATQQRLAAKGLPNGITALLHGFPGTGKTETVLQIAKETNREIIKVDISQSKSMWFGESEKIIKRIFTNYKSYAKDCELKPILLFNEADAIFGKRKEIGNSNIDQTENTIQNILLEELESFDGIFLATTNLVKNLDTAFERRFLFKIEFHKPENSIKSKIWNSKLPTLTENECNTLANRFDFSGGQIDNIIRKNEIYEILHGITVDFNSIVEFCNSELLLKNKSFKVGFTKE